MEDQREEVYSGDIFEGGQYIHLTEVLSFKDSRGKEDRFDKARRSELQGLEEMGT